jgi:hypothetical protein
VATGTLPGKPNRSQPGVHDLHPGPKPLVPAMPGFAGYRPHGSPAIRASANSGPRNLAVGRLPLSLLRIAVIPDPATSPERHTRPGVFAAHSGPTPGRWTCPQRPTPPTVRTVLLPSYREIEKRHGNSFKGATASPPSEGMDH